MQMECNSKLFCAMDPFVLRSDRQQVNQGMEPSLLKAGCW